MVAKIKPVLKQKYSIKKYNYNPIVLLHEYCKTIEDWPASWEISEEDLRIGQAIMEQFKLFLISRIEKGRSKRTVKKDASYLWVLGGELIRQVNENDRDRRLLAKKLILKYIDGSGGPYWRHARDELEHSQYDSVCKQFFKFIIDNSE